MFKIDKYLDCYIIEFVDDHGCSVVEDDADAPLPPDVRGDHDGEDDEEGVASECKLKNHQGHKKFEKHVFELFWKVIPMIGGNQNRKQRSVNILQKEHPRKSQEQVTQHLVYHLVSEVDTTISFVEVFRVLKHYC